MGSAFNHPHPKALNPPLLSLSLSLTINFTKTMAAVDGEESLKSLSAADPLLFLYPNPDLSRHARTAASHLYSSLLPFCPKPKPPFDELLTGDSFDAEQIWCQIDLLSRPVVSMLRREVRRLERDPPAAAAAAVPKEKVKKVVKEKEEEDEEEEDDEEERDEEDSDEEEEEENEGNGVEDKFLKIKELEEYLEEDEEREFGEIKGKSKKKMAEDEDEEDDEDDGNEFDLQFGDLDDDEDEDYAENATYGDFFGGKNKGGGSKKDERKNEKRSSKKMEFRDELEKLDLDDEQMDDSDVDNQENGTLSTHEKQLLKIQSKIEQMEKANLEPKSWTMQGEVTAAKRPKNSALEVDLDFEHNMRPPPPVTEESTASLEDLIKNRIIEGRFYDVQRAPALPSKAPKELKELDENKSKKGLAELYEEEYAQQTGLASAPLSSSDEQKKEATSLFKRLCLKLDALSHFHFAPKPVIEDMSIKANVPALAMEEIAPVAVSDAAMLAPEEVFKGKGDIKEEAELTQEERKRRRANKKRKFRAKTANREAKKARQNAALSHSNDTGNEDS